MAAHQRHGARTGIKGDEELDQVVGDVVTAGLVERRVDGVVLHKHNGKRRPAWGSGGAVLLMRQSAVYGGR